jgi:hypothetical protein
VIKILASDTRALCVTSDNGVNHERPQGRFPNNFCNSAVYTGNESARVGEH